MYERHEEPLLTLERFWSRVARHGLVGLAIVAGSLLFAATDARHGGIIFLVK